MSDLFDDDNDHRKKKSAAEMARDEALKRVKENGRRWHNAAVTSLHQINGFAGTAEDIRLELESAGLPAPHHHNAWGAVIRAALSYGLLLHTGEWRKMRTPKSHARRTPVYLVKG